MYGYAILALIGFLMLRGTVDAIRGPFVAQRAARRRESARLIADADYQQWHALHGDRRTGMFGWWQPWT